LSEIRLAGWDDRSAVARLRRAWTEESAGHALDDEPGGMLNPLVFTRMPHACLAYADEQGFARVVLSPTEWSVPFYAPGGFVPATSLMIRELAAP
jgi:hypothetical protein